MIYRIPDENLEPLREKLAKLRKKAVKLNQQGIVMTVLSTETEVKGTEDRPEIFVYHNVLVSGVEPKINGWTFVATLQHADEAGTIIRSVPGQELPTSYRDSDPGNCDHCHLYRMRKDTFVVRHDDGTHKQVGRNCLRDFLGHGDPNQVAAYAELCSLIGEMFSAAEEPGFFGGMRNDRYLSTEWVIQLAAAAVREYGWKSKKSAMDFGGTPTSQYVFNTIFQPNPRPRDYKMLMATEQDKAMAAAALDWVREDLANKSELNDYEHNLTVIMKSEAIEPRSLGLAVSLIAAYQRAADILKRKEAVAKQFANSTYIGKPGERLVFTAQIISVREFASDFGVSYQHIMMQGDDQIVWYGSKRLEEGATYTFKATVKKQNIYNDVQQTVITRLMGEKKC